MPLSFNFDEIGRRARLIPVSDKLSHGFPVPSGGGKTKKENINAHGYKI